RVQAEELREELTHAVDDDSAAFEAVMGAFRLPKESEEQQKARTAAIQRSTLNAAHVPLHTVKDSVKVMELALRCAQVGNLSAISDSASALTMARAAVTAAGYNVRINVNSLPEKSAGSSFVEELTELEAKASELEKRLQAVMKERGGI
ncbi:MAG TPA: cyclodeaminase/cyclohydrolase family protein, partial [Anaerolineales bacterium]|nr:cyclodeaminase/cyclohydrolase family protein [Anaerolineales bacterium]